eukprot:1182934-Prorocentrum_minimum.AAC.1
MGDSHNYAALFYPLVLSATSIFVCLVTSLLATTLRPALHESAIQYTLKTQLVRLPRLPALRPPRLGRTNHRRGERIYP